MDLPSEPGRRRMIAYGQYIRNRNRRPSGNSNERFATYEQLLELDPIKVGLTLRECVNASIVSSQCKLFCSICQEETQFRIVRRLHCGHSYHMSCVDEWLSDNTRCPLCKTDLRTIEIKK